MDSANYGAIEHSFLLGAPACQAPGMALTQMMGLKIRFSTAIREVEMRRLLRNAMTLSAFTVGMTCACMAQSATTQPVQSASVEPPASPATGTPAPGTDATHPASNAAQPELQPTVAQELDALKSRIDQLENEVKEEKARALADSSDTAAMKAAEKELVAGDGSAMAKPGVGMSPSLQAAAPAAPAEPAAPEIGAQTTTKGEPFPGDWTWLNSNGHATDSPMATKYFTPEFRADANYIFDYNHPIDDTMGGATESFRSDEWQLEQISIGGDIRINNVRGRILTMDGLFATTTPRNDGSVNRGNWDLAGAYKYVSEAWGGYHWDVAHGLNVDAGIFVSYIGLFSYYNFDNWTYQPSFVSSNTPWFFNGVRVQWYLTNKLKIEPWFINGWQSYAKYNGHPGLGGQLLWQPTESFKLVANQYGFGQDNLGLPHTERIHTDDSIEVRYYNHPESTGISKMAFSLTGDAGAQYGGGLCGTCGPSSGKESFVGWMLYDRTWFHKDLFGLTLGGGEMSNWGRYLTLLPPIDGATAATGTPYFTELPGQRAHMWDSTITLQYMPKQYITWGAEIGYRHSDVPYFAGRGGVTPPGGNNGLAQYYTCLNGTSAGTGTLAAAQ